MQTYYAKHAPADWHISYYGVVCVCPLGKSMLSIASLRFELRLPEYNH
jgi:hypothetical protein